MTGDKLTAVSRADEYLPYREVRISTAQKQEYRALLNDWKGALAESNANTDPSDQVYNRLARAEDAAYDSLCDWVEENHLDWSKYDPRGPERADPDASTERATS
jgi:hypothetical protein